MREGVMARSRAKRTKGGQPADTLEMKRFNQRLINRPTDWLVTIAVRTALRTLPLIGGEDSNFQAILSAFRAVAVARYAAKYPDRRIGSAPIRSSEALAPFVKTSATLAADAAAKAVAAAANVSTRSAVSIYVTRAVRAATETLTASTTEAASFVSAAIEDGNLIDSGRLSSEQLAGSQLWFGESPFIAITNWDALSDRLISQAPHWSIWIDWYRDALLGLEHESEHYHAAFTDLPDILPWAGGAEAVNTEITRRLEAIGEHTWLATATVFSEPSIESRKRATIARLAEVASPQPSLTDEDLLDAGPNQPFDIPTIDEDLSTLPLRQRSLIKGILGDLPANAPRHLKSFLRSYDEELKSRGTQPILGLLKDDADIIAAAVAAQRADDEWLEPGMRKAFDRFAENHTLFVEHFPLDAEREEVYAQTSVDESKATGRNLEEPLEAITKATEQAHKAGEVTDDFRAVVNSMNELGRVVATLPPETRAPEIKVSPEDRIVSVTVKKRTILGALGFFKRAVDLLDERKISLTASGLQISEALRQVVQALLRFLP